jgi:hypothetical protein
MTQKLIVASLAVLALSLSACSSGDDTSGSKAKASASAPQTGTDQKAASSLSDQITASQKTGAASVVSVKKSEADCIGKGMVARIGTSKLQDYGVLDEEFEAKNSVTGVKFEPADAQAATGVFFDCADIEGLMRKAVSKGGVPKPVRACLDKTLTEKNLRPFLEKTFEGDAAAAQKRLTEPVTRCVASRSAG